MALDILNKTNAPVVDDWEIKRKVYATFVRLLEDQKNCIFSADMSNDVEDFLNVYVNSDGMNYEVVSIEAELEDRNDLCTQIIGMLNSITSLNNIDFYDLYSSLISHTENKTFGYVDQCWEKILSFVGKINNILLVLLDFDYYENSINNGEIARLRQLTELPGVKFWIIGEHNADANGERKLMRLKRIFKHINKEIFYEYMISVKEPYVYISYNWEDKSNVTADYLYDTLQRHFAVRRDKVDCNYRENIKEFMEAIREGQYIVLILSQEYLKSENCMFELVGVMKHPDYKNRLFPIVCDSKDSTVRDDDFYVELLKEWKQKLDEKKALVEKAKEANEKGAAPLEEKLKELVDVNEFLAEIKRYVDYANAPSFVAASNERFSRIIEAIKKQMELNKRV